MRRSKGSESFNFFDRSLQGNFDKYQIPATIWALEGDAWPTGLIQVDIYQRWHDCATVQLMTNPLTPTKLPALRRRPAATLSALGSIAVSATGCDPVVNFYGSFFPAWIICLTLGIFLTALLRWLFAALRLERHLGPLVLIYPALAFLLSASVWLVLFSPNS